MDIGYWVRMMQRLWTNGGLKDVWDWLYLDWLLGGWTFYLTWLIALAIGILFWYAFTAWIIAPLILTLPAEQQGWAWLVYTLALLIIWSRR